VARIGFAAARACQLLTTIACGLTALATGCNECTPGTARCQGDVYRYCIDDGDGPFATARWMDTPCAVTCREVSGRSFCADARAPVPECAGDTEFLTCLDGAPTRCIAGYPVRQQICNAGTHCAVSAACGPICVTGDAPEPRCAQTRFCDGNDYVTCTCDFVLSRFSCGAGETCRTMGGGTQCTPPDRDARCGDPAQPSFGFCDGDTAVNCWYGYLVGATECAPVAHCDVLPTLRGAGCAIPVSTATR